MTEHNSDPMISIHEEVTPIVNSDTPEDVKEFMDKVLKNVEPDFEIHVVDNNVNSGSISISWCLSKDNLEKHKGDLDPCVVIITAPVDNYNKYKERRKVVRLKDLLAYIDFSSPGENRVFAFIHSNFKSAKDSYLSRYDRHYAQDVLNYDGDEVYDYLNISYSKKNKKELLTVNVPEELFAKKPSQWEQDWVNWLSPKNPAFDQCDFRRKRLFAYTLQIVPFVFTLLCRLGIFLWAVLWLNRGTFNILNNIIHPLRLSLSQLTGTFWGESVFSYNEIKKTDAMTWDENGNSVPYYKSETQYRYLLFTPGGLLCLFALASLGMFVYSRVSNWIIVLMVFSMVIGATISVVGAALATRFIKKSAEAPITDDDIDLLVCSENKVKSIKDVRKKSIRLRYDDLKNKVCKPFSM